MAINEISMPPAVHTRSRIALSAYTDGVATDRDDNLWTRDGDGWLCTESRSDALGQHRGPDQVVERPMDRPSPIRWHS